MFVLRSLEKLVERVKLNNKYSSIAESTMKEASLLPLISLLSFSTGYGTQQPNAPVVTVSEGKLQGTTKPLLNGTPYYSFKGIPYAQPPVGQLRFRAPQPPKPWHGIRNASEHGSICPQYDFSVRDSKEGNEDCLFLNVYTKSLQKGAKIPVMVFIHGGSYSSGSGDADRYGPEYLFLHDVILVTINYRLEVLGFLSLDTPEVPGNAGIKDQVAALRWVKKNIAQFGGDPDNITIFGESSGSASVTLHMLSPMSKGLFHKAIAQSVACTQDWAIGRDARERAFRVGKVLGKDTNDTNELLEFLRSVPAITLTKLTTKTRTPEEKYRDLPIHFAPVVEQKFADVEAFLTEEPLDMLLAQKIHKVPLMLGYNSAEGLIMLADQLNKTQFMNHHPFYYVQRELTGVLTQNKLVEFGERIKSFYVGKQDLSNDTAEAIVNLNTDIHFAYNVHRFAQFYTETKMPVYLYRFDAVTDLNVMKRVFGFWDMKGVAHADDLFYLFYNDYNKDAYADQEELRKIVFDLTKLWTDFAKSGNPTPDNSVGIKWLPYTKSGKEYMSLDKKFTMGQYADRDRMEFWNKLYCESNIPCYKKSSL